jgi:hypothetical protein
MWSRRWSRWRSQTAQTPRQTLVQNPKPNHDRGRIALAGFSASLLLLPSRALAQLPPPPAVPEMLRPPSAYTPCLAPAAGEYGLLILRWSLTDQERAQQVLPPTMRWQLCNYPSRQQNLLVMQVRDLSNLASAQALGQQVTDATGLPTVVTQPAANAVNSLGAIAPPPSPGSPIAYSPQPLGPGYAVIIDFGDRPELAAQLQSLLGRTVGLVAYDQRAYLLGLHTLDATTATALVQDLDRQGLSAQSVDSRQVLVLRSAVAIGPE